MSTELKDSLQFVKGALPKHTIVPVLQHFQIKDNFVTAMNGIIEIGAKLPVNIEVCPSAKMFVRAIENCKETITLHLTKTGKLNIKSGKFSAFVDCVPMDTFPSTMVDAYRPHKVEVLPIFKALLPFIGEDTHRMWSRGILIEDGYAYATNNVTAVQYYHGQRVPRVIIPVEAINEVLRVGSEPECLGIGERTICFYYPENSYIKSITHDSTKFPNIAPILDKCVSAPVELDEAIFTHIKALIPFADNWGTVHFKDGAIATSKQEGQGASLADVVPVDWDISFIASMFNLCAKSSKIAMSEKAGYFFGENYRGIVVGCGE